MTNKWGLSPTERLSLMQAMRDTLPPITDSQIGQVFGISRQRVFQKLGPKPASLPRKNEAEVIQYLEQGISFAAITRELGNPYGQVVAIARENHFTRGRLAAIRFLRRRWMIKQDLVEYTKKGWPLTATYLSRWDALPPKTSLCTRAASVQSFEDWRIELGLNDKTILNQRLAIKKE